MFDQKALHEKHHTALDSQSVLSDRSELIFIDRERDFVVWVSVKLLERWAVWICRSDR